jgi:hypothetical protein
MWKELYGKRQWREWKSKQKIFYKINQYFSIQTILSIYIKNHKSQQPFAYKTFQIMI